jgi:hypothetical protein
MAKKKPKKQRAPNEKFGRKKPIPFRDVVERLLQTRPDKRKGRD